jgi:hypothetical protein
MIDAIVGRPPEPTVGRVDRSGDAGLRQRCAARSAGGLSVESAAVTRSEVGSSHEYGCVGLVDACENPPVKRAHVVTIVVSAVGAALLCCAGSVAVVIAGSGGEDDRPSARSSPTPTGPSAVVPLGTVATSRYIAPYPVRQAPLFQPPGSASLIGPGYGVDAYRSASAQYLVVDDKMRAELTAVPAITYPNPTGQTVLKAPEGAELVSVILGAAEGGLVDFVGMKPESTVDYSVMVGDRPPVTISKAAEDLLVVVSVEKGAKATLVAGDAEHRQGLDIRTGSRIDQIKDFYNAPVADDPGGLAYFTVRFRSGALAGKERPISADPALAIVPWGEGVGWAPSGKVWLRCAVHYQTFSDESADITLDARSVEVTADGQTYRPQPGSMKVSVNAGKERVSLPGAQQPGEAYFIAVPPQLRQGTLKILPTGSAVQVLSSRDTSFEFTLESRR